MTTTEMSVDLIDGMNACTRCGQRAGIDRNDNGEGYYVHDRTGLIECQRLETGRDPRTTNRFGVDNCLDMSTMDELVEGMRNLAAEALGRVQAAKSDRHLYDLLLDLKATIVEVRRRVPGAPLCECGCGREVYEPGDTLAEWHLG